MRYFEGHWYLVITPQAHMVLHEHARTQLQGAIPVDEHGTEITNLFEKPVGYAIKLDAEVMKKLQQIHPDPSTAILMAHTGGPR